MDTVSKHITNHLEDFIEKPNEGFLEIFSVLSNTEKNRLEKLLVYIEKILDHTTFTENKKINYLHLHIDEDFNFSDRSLILEFLIVKYFMSSLKDDQSKELNHYVHNKILKLNREIESNQIPDGASGKNGGNRIYKNYYKLKKEKKDELSYNNTILYSNKLKANTLVNTLTKHFNECLEIFKSKHYGIRIEDINQKKSYVTINNNRTLEQIDEADNIVDNIQNILLFDSESKSNFINSNLIELNDWNKDGTSFKNLIILTFGNKKANINNLKNKLNQVNFKFENNTKDKINSYTIAHNEINQLKNINKKQQITTSFYGLENNTFWDLFLSEIQIHENLYELISIKLRNIYSLVINEKIKKIVLENIFGNDDKQSFISEKTKQELPEELKQELRENLSNTLDYIINSRWKDEMKSLIDENTILVVSNEILKNKILVNELRTELGILKSNKLITWESISLDNSENLLILNYLDPGQYPYYFYPNIIELSAKNSIGFFLNLFFKNKYQWANYNNNNDYYILHNHQLRLDYFDWNSIKQSISKLKPTVKEKTSWDIENSYVHSDNKEVIKIKLISENRASSYHSSDLFICKYIKSIKIIRAIELLDFNIDSIEIQNLNDIVNELPIYDKLADINKQEEELNIIRKKFNIEHVEDAGRLWKVLLKRESDKYGKEQFYSKIKELLKHKNLKIVSFQHFENHWINPQSKSLSPLVKKVFLTICNYLNLPKSYIILISRIKNKTKQASRTNTKKINHLFNDLFNDGCFDDLTEIGEILTSKIKYYRQNHSLEELGIDEDYLLENLIALVELIKPEIDLQKVDSIEIINL